MDELRAQLERAGFRISAAAAPTAIAQMASAFGVTLLDGFARLWAVSDGMRGEGIDILPLSAVSDYADIFEGGFGYLPFTDCNDSNPYAVCCRGPLRGKIVHIFHDDQSVVVCRDLDRFLELVIEARQSGDDVDRLPGDYAFDHPDRTAQDASTA